MSKNCLLIILIFFSKVSTSQINFEKGYFIKNSGEKVECLIKNIGWGNNPQEFQYKLSANGQERTTSINAVKEFIIYNESKYVRAEVDIDRSSGVISKLSNTRNPIFKKEILFLKVLIEGKANLYQYIDGNLKRYFFNVDGGKIEQLVYKKYKIPGNFISTNDLYKQQLATFVSCENLNSKKLQNVSYHKRELINYFINYNSCYGFENTSFEKEEKAHFNLTIRPRINNSSLKINSFLRGVDIDFDKNNSFGIGAETEYLFPFNKNKWSIFLELVYQNFNSKSETFTDFIGGGKIISEIDYKSIEVPFGLRHYFYINDNSKIFLNAAYVIDFNFKSTIDFRRADGSIIETKNIKTRNNFAFGLGYKILNKYSVELRAQTARGVLANFTTSYKSLSLILGYTPF